jgi:peptidoglycan/LPS O-acetylase OafA/YrhL
LVGNALFLYPFSDTRWIIGVCWTLSVEFQFYIIIGLLFNILFKQKNALWFVSLFITMMALPLIPNFPPHTFFSYSPLFALGGTALLYKKNCVSIVGFGLLLILFFGLSCLMMPLAASTFGLGTTLIIALVKVRHRFFSFFGKISFSLYLIHVLVGSIAEFMLAKLLPEKTALQQCLGILLLTLLALMAAYAYYMLVEKPTLRLGKKIH